jgi:hypothetical protein
MPARAGGRRKVYGRAEHQANRRELLDGRVRCCWPGCSKVADTLDHVPALALHEHEDGTGCCAVRPMCRPHNSRAGALLGAQLRAAKKARARAPARRCAGLDA